MIWLKQMSLDIENQFIEFEQRFKLEAKNEIIPFSLNPNNLPFKEFLDILNGLSNGQKIPKGMVPTKYYLIMNDNIIVGAINLRYEDSPYVLNYAGHIGYGIAPWERGNGYAKAGLQAMLELAKNLGLNKILITTDKDNYASKRVIISNGGVFNKIEKNEFGEKEFYWISLQ